MGYAQAATRVYQFVPDNVLQLANAEFRRKIFVGNQWQRIRLGFLASVVPNGIQNDVALLQCLFGMSSSVGPGVSQANTANFIGVSLIGAPPAGNTLTYTTGYPNNYYARSSENVFAKLGAAYTLGTADTSALVWCPQGVGNFRRFPYILDITRPAGGAGTYTLSVYGVAAAGATVDHRPDHFFSCLDITGTPVSNGVTLTVICNARTISWSEIGGPLDTISLYWSKISSPLEVSAIGAAIQDVTIYGETSGGYIESWGAGTLTPDIYSYGTVLSGTLTPSYATGPISSSGSAANLAIYDTVSGTSTGPADSFDSYSVGTVDSGLTLTGGLGWAGPGYVYQW